MASAPMQIAIAQLISRHCSSLKKLTVRYSWRYGPHFFPLDVILSGCPMLSALGLYHVNLGKIFPSLEDVMGEPRPRYPVKILKLAGRSGDIRSLLRCCPHLQELELSYCPGITRDIFAVLKTFCPKLWKLVVLHCKLISKEMLETYSTSTGVKIIDRSW